MSEFFQLIISNPIQALAFVLMLACAGLVGIIARFIVRRWDEHEKKIAGFEKAFGEDLKKTRASLLVHSDDMGKATKAVNGDMLQIKESVFSLRQDLIHKASELQTFTKELEMRTAQLAQTLELTTERFDEKLAHIITLRQDIKTAFGKIETLETNTGQFRITMGNFAKIIKGHDDKLKGK